MQTATRTPSLDNPIEACLAIVERTSLAFAAVLIAFAALYAAGVWCLLDRPALAAVVFGLSVLAMCCGGIAGGCVGFLFGIPRLLDRWTRTGGGETGTISGSPPALASRTDAARGLLLSNSNLEDVSDWLTKIIVGLGLIHLTRFQGWFADYGTWMAASLQTEAAPAIPGAATYFLVITLAAILLGFLFLYLQTRTRITLLLLGVEQMRDSSWQDSAGLIADSPQIVRAPENGRRTGTAPSPAAPIALDPAVRAEPPGPNDASDAWAAWAAASMRQRDFHNAEFGWRMAIGKDTRRSPQLWQRLAEVLEIRSRDIDAIAAYRTARALGASAVETLKDELRLSLYIPGPDGCRQAIALADELMRHETAAADPWVQFWRIAAHGQHHAWLVRTGAHATEIDAARSTVAAAISRLIAQLPNAGDPVRILLRQVLDPAAAGQPSYENDLESLKDDAEIEAMIRGA